MEKNIEYRTVQVPTKIVIDGVNYPITQWNIRVVGKYEETGDESVLADLKDFALEM